MMRCGGLLNLCITWLAPMAIAAQQDAIFLAEVDRSRSEPDTASLAMQQDSVDAASPVITSALYGSLSTSFAASQNWGGQDLTNYAFTGNLLYRHNLLRGGRSHSHSHQLAVDLGYVKFVDSTWVKHIDRFQANLLWNSTGRKFNHSYSIVLATQFLSNTMLEYSAEEERLKERPVGGFLDPFSLDVGYGAVWSFWQGSNINFAFATLRFSGSPKATTAPAFTDANTIEGKKAFYFLNYGFFITTAIKKPIGKHVEWINATRFFANGMDRDHVNLDFSNMVIVKLWKYLQLRMDTRVAYNPLLNYDIQFRQEVLVGFFYERNR